MIMGLSRPRLARPQLARPQLARHALLLAAVGLLAACGQDTSRSFGFTRDAPDEFATARRVPLSLPPDYALRPPTPGAPRPQETSARDGAEATLLGVTSAATGAGAQSRGEEALLSQAGPAPTTPSEALRRRVDEESRRLDMPPRTLADRLIFWQPAPAPGTPVDPTAEARRLRENAALGRDVTSGNTPIIERRRKGLLEGLF